MAWLLLGLMMSFPISCKRLWCRVGHLGGGNLGSFMETALNSLFLRVDLFTRSWSSGSGH